MVKVLPHHVAAPTLLDQPAVAVRTPGRAICLSQDAAVIEEDLFHQWVMEVNYGPLLM